MPHCGCKGYKHAPEPEGTSLSESAVIFTAADCKLILGWIHLLEGQAIPMLPPLGVGGLISKLIPTDENMRLAIEKLEKACRGQSAQP